MNKLRLTDWADVFGIVSAVAIVIIGGIIIFTLVKQEQLARRDRAVAEPGSDQ